MPRMGEVGRERAADLGGESIRLGGLRGEAVFGALTLTRRGDDEDGEARVGSDERVSLRSGWWS